MPRIITPPRERTATCPHCTAVIGYTSANIRAPGHFADDPDTHIRCPACDGKIIVTIRQAPPV